MKSLRVVLALVFIAVLIVACSSGHEKDLIGKWQKEDGRGTIEFTTDGKLNLAGGPATITATCVVKDKGHLQADLGIFGMVTLKYALDKDSLTLTDTKGSHVKYTRVKEAKEVKKPEAPKAQAEQPKAQPEAPKAQPQAPAKDHK